MDRSGSAARYTAFLVAGNSNGSCMLGLDCVLICHYQPAIMLVRLLGNATLPVGLRVLRALVCMAV
jgi:hypothetical protein